MAAEDHEAGGRARAEKRLLPAARPQAEKTADYRNVHRLGQTHMVVHLIVWNIFQQVARLTVESPAYSIQRREAHGADLTRFDAR